ncbi:ribosome silencing factor [Anaerolentibacter hominis]|uniref:ribosome silencing factor n=1 Tax=Anaerolentibacter hominis TaxID=3079009 RepID=UPI0031B892F6
MNDSKKMVRLAYDALEERKAEDIRVIEIGDISTIADYFLIANGTNPNQVSAMVDSVKDVLGREGFDPKRIEGLGNASWILMDYGDIIIHVFSKEDRAFYDLERIWRDGKMVEKSELDAE